MMTLHNNYFEAGFSSSFSRNNLELRGVWVATTRNLNFPSPSVYQAGFNVNLFKSEYLEILRTAKLYNLNAIFFQVRPEGDAFYSSQLNPWSKYLTGQQGLAPGLNFDPLKFLIEETHKAGIEFHAWFNPYRLISITESSPTKQIALGKLSNKNVAKRNPDWTYLFNGLLFFNPGVPEVNNYMVQTINEVLFKYNVDGIHLDDYFYPYPFLKDGVMVNFKDVSPDYETYLRYRKSANQSIDKWREFNINNLVFLLSNAVRSYNVTTGKSVEFGISPFGVWASDLQAPGGSKTSAAQLSSLEEYVDTKYWIEQGWLDYVVPQIYWSLNHNLSQFDIVAKWWADITANTKTKLYIGLGLYLYDEEDGFDDPQEIIKQLEVIKSLPTVTGYVIFAYSSLLVENAKTSGMKSALTALQSYK